MSSNKAVTAVDAYIGEKIRGYRNLRNISQEELGRMLGVSFQQIQKYEKGANRITSSRLQEIAKIFECDVADILPEQKRGKKTQKLSNLDRVAATRDGMKLIDSFVDIKNEVMRAAVVELARRFCGH
ncbi:helix-turn-helix domain-containing protein [Bradyrhizobium japonicum]|uniref:helix-turn-helix domain-containing protein n=1 Tax=Bradyrhizobium japonicum TaxID=375 RepID=UPI001E5B4017|nr:helix-turn-helix transcriptional regulator [Bradyrhizobium japonicum]MCD9821220.1 helix-turn-helix domain-containing protein [Bradyrhizobium japonicum]MEB2674084.1 helix-turn-helix transcriptional regulator [Bradyrhizobium japonicum]WRI93270.1 helix-turn-helix transcriptional regulator [Bradyrhizobium japonicum]